MLKKLTPLSSLFTLLVLGMASPTLAQLPELPTAPPAPPATPSTPENSSPAPPSSPTSNEGSIYLRPQTACPEDFETLSTLLVRDIPSYTNRILQSSVADIPTAYRPAYVITANYPERMPLDIKDQVYTTNPDGDESLHQLFFTTLERQYSGLDAASISHFHWLFLTPSDEGWDMVFIFSAIGDNETVLPPRDSSQGSVGQAVQRWLRDCRVRAIAPGQ